MFYKSATDWGLKGVDGDILNPVFQLGSKNTISGFTIRQNYLENTDQTIGAAILIRTTLQNYNVYSAIGSGSTALSSGMTVAGVFSNQLKSGQGDSIALFVEASGVTDATKFYRNIGVWVNKGDIKLSSGDLIIGNGSIIGQDTTAAGGTTVTTKGKSIIRVTSVASGSRVTLADGYHGQHLDVINDTLSDVTLNTARDEFPYNFLKGKSKKSLIFIHVSSSNKGWYGEADNN